MAVVPGEVDGVDDYLAAVQAVDHSLPLYVISELPPTRGIHIPYHPQQSFARNLERIRWALRRSRVRWLAIWLHDQMPAYRLRWLACQVSTRLMFFNRALNHFVLHPRSLPAIARHVAWWLRDVMRRETRPGGELYTWAWRLIHPRSLWRPYLVHRALATGRRRRDERSRPPLEQVEVTQSLPAGISVVIPSRDGRALLERLLPGVMDDLVPVRHEVLVVDNGSTDGSASWLRERYPAVKLFESDEPLSFAAAVNVGIAAARYSQVCLLNNDMVMEPGFFGALQQAFVANANLFCATAQIFFPQGQRRQETGKAVLPQRRLGSRRDDFFLTCLEPLAEEDHTYVLYGSAGCSLYDAAKLRALGGFDELLAPAYVEDLDIGFRAWQQAWPTVYVAGARVTHHHQQTTKRFFTKSKLTRILDRNYLGFLLRAVAEPASFWHLWQLAIERLNLRASRQVPDLKAIDALRFAAFPPEQWQLRDVERPWRDRWILGIGDGSVFCFPGRQRRGKPLVVVVGPYVPYPLAHGGAVRMYNLMRRAARDYDQVLVTFCEEAQAPARELLDICAEVVMVKRPGSHERRESGRPDAVEEFDVDAMHGALRQTILKWSPFAVQIEFTWMAEYAQDCEDLPRILVEHDITFDLWEQQVALEASPDNQHQLELWRRYEVAAWRGVDEVVVMSERDRARAGSEARVIANGVDTARFMPDAAEPEPHRILFIGSFAHLPNLQAVDWLVNEVLPRVTTPVTVHIIAGRGADEALGRYPGQVDIARAGIEFSGFVADVREAYRKAALVVAPLLASAGTNIKVLEAMAMGKAVVTTPAGIHGLDAARDAVTVASSAEDFARSIDEHLRDRPKREALERRAREVAVSDYDWDRIAESQSALYQKLLQLAADRGIVQRSE